MENFEIKSITRGKTSLVTEKGYDVPYDKNEYDWNYFDVWKIKEEVEEYKDRDPIEQVKQRILDFGIATQADLDAIDAKIKVQVQESVDFAEVSPFPTADEAYKDVYVQEDYPFIVE